MANKVVTRAGFCKNDFQLFLHGMEYLILDLYSVHIDNVWGKVYKTCAAKAYEGISD